MQAVERDKEIFPLTKGATDFFDSLVEEAEERITPVDIITFATDKNYCGKKLYIEQSVILKTIYNIELSEIEKEVYAYWEEQGYVPKDLRERREKRLSNFKEVIMVVGRRGSKSFIAGIMAAYAAYLLILKNNPQEYYGIEEDKELFIYCVARSGPQTKKTIFADVKSTIINCKFLQKWIHPDHTGVTETEVKIQTPHDRMKEMDLDAKGIPHTPIASIKIVSLHSNSASLRGPTVFFAILSEIAHFLDTNGRLSGGAVYDAIAPSIRQFGDDGIIVLESTPWSQVGKFYEEYCRGIGIKPDGTDLDYEAYSHIALFHMPSWEMYRYAGNVGMHPILTFEDVEDEALTNPDSFWVEYGAQFATTLEAYFDPELVDAVFDPRIKVKEMGIHRFRYKFHCDPGLTGANFSVVGGHEEIIGKSVWKFEFDQSMWELPIVVVDYIKAYKPSDFEGHEVDYFMIGNELVDLGKTFNLDEMTFDQWNSAGSIAHVRNGFQKMGKTHIKVKVDYFTEKKNFSRYENLKAAMLQRRVKIPLGREGSDAHLLKLEMKFLQKKNMKVEKQTSGPIQTKDLADCLGMVVMKVLGDIREQDFPRAAMGLPAESVMGQGSNSFDDFYRERGVG